MTRKYYDESKWTPLMKLAVDSLIARKRLGENQWSFDSDSNTTRALRKLENLGVVYMDSGILEKTFDVALTGQYWDSIKDNYNAPIFKGGERQFGVKIFLDGEFPIVEMSLEKALKVARKLQESVYVRDTTAWRKTLRSDL
jgi:hypothetical protein